MHVSLQPDTHSTLGFRGDFWGHFGGTFCQKMPPNVNDAQHQKFRKQLFLLYIFTGDRWELLPFFRLLINWS